MKFVNYVIFILTLNLITGCSNINSKINDTNQLLVSIEDLAISPEETCALQKKQALEMGITNYQKCEPMDPVVLNNVVISAAGGLVLVKKNIKEFEQKTLTNEQTKTVQNIKKRTNVISEKLRNYSQNRN